MASDPNITDLNTIEDTQSSSRQTYRINPTFAFLLPVLILCSILGNALIIYAFRKVPGLRARPSDLLILNLAIVDFAVGFVIILGSPLWITPSYWPIGEAGCRITALSFFLTNHASLLTLIFIILDRLLLVLKEYPQYLKMQSPVRIRLQIAICWIISITIALQEQELWNVAKTWDKSAALIDYSKFCLSPPRRLWQFALTYFIILYLGPVLCICTMSIIFFILIRKRVRKNQQAEHATSENQHTRSRYIKPAITLAVLVIAMAVCMLPYCIYVFMIETFCPQYSNANIIFGLILLQFCNSILDPILYGLTQRKLRQHFCGSCLPKNVIHPPSTVTTKA